MSNLRRQSSTAMTDKPWTAPQHDAIVAAALALRAEKLAAVTAENPTGTLSPQTTGHARGYQAEYLRKAMQAVNNRPGPRHECKADPKLQNISYWLIELGHAPIPGFKPLNNASNTEGRALAAQIEIHLDRMAREAAEREAAADK